MKCIFLTALIANPSWRYYSHYLIILFSRIFMHLKSMSPQQEQLVTF